MHRRGLRLRSRFALVVLAGVGLVSLAMAWITFVESRDSLIEANQQLLFEMAGRQSSTLARDMARISSFAKDLAATIEVLRPKDQEIIHNLLRGFLDKTPAVYGSAVAFQPYAFDPGKMRCSPYLFRSPKGYTLLNLNAKEYDYLKQDWYQSPALKMVPMWSEPYIDEGGGNIIMTTYSVPFFYDGKLKGVVTADVSLEALEKQVSRLAVGEKGWAFVISKRGSFLAAPQSDLVLRQTIFSLAEDRNTPGLRQLGRKMVRGGSGVLRIKDWDVGTDDWLAYAPVNEVGWSFAVVVPEEEVLEPAWELASKQAMTALGGLLILAMVIWLVVVNLTRPLNRLTRAARVLASGDLSTRVEGIPPGDEIGELALSFNKMVQDLEKYVGELTETTAAKERIESELDLARQIQQSILPRCYPPFPERPEFDLYAKNLPAREVGGDFYDFFFVDHDHLAMVVGDVSGKGVPSALFMTVARTLIKNAAIHHLDPVEVLEEVNRQIIPENEMCMFVTIFYGVYTVSTGEMVYASAGHPAPLVRRWKAAAEQMPKTAGMAVGILEEMGLERAQIHLAVGDIMLIYTDGLDEAIDAEERMYGVDRALGWLNTATVSRAPEMVDSLVQDQRGFTGDVEQFDDLTLLLFRRTE